MIEFYGEYYEDSKRFMLKKHAVLGLYVALVTSILCSVVILIIAAVLKLWIITWFMIVLALLIILAIFAPYIQKARTLHMIVPRKINIADDGYMYVQLSSNTISRSLSKVKKVIDMGKSYYVTFYFKIDGFLCQKNLLKQGTIEDFENLFEGKIVRKVLRD